MLFYVLFPVWVLSVMTSGSGWAEHQEVSWLTHVMYAASLILGTKVVCPHHARKETKEGCRLSLSQLWHLTGFSASRPANRYYGYWWKSDSKLKLESAGNFNTKSLISSFCFGLFFFYFMEKSWPSCKNYVFGTLVSLKGLTSRGLGDGVLFSFWGHF